MNVCYPCGIDGEFLHLTVTNCTNSDPVGLAIDPHLGHFTLINSEGTGIGKGIITANMEWQVDVPDTMFAFGRMSVLAEQKEHDEMPEIPEGMSMFKIDSNMAKRIQDMVNSRRSEPQEEPEEEPRRNGGYL